VPTNLTDDFEVIYEAIVLHLDHRGLTRSSRGGASGTTAAPTRDKQVR